MNHVCLNRQVLLNELGRIRVIRENPTRLSRCQEHVCRLLFLKEDSHGRLFCQIKFFVAASNKILVAFGLQLPRQGEPTNPR